MTKINKVVCVFDRGNYISYAITLSKHFERVLYHCVHEADFTKRNEALIGQGVPEIEWVDDFDDIIKETDIFIFPDCRDAGKQVELTRLGKQVWGGFDAVKIENDRWRANELLGEAGLPKVDMERAEGVTDLKDKLKKLENSYLKGNFRADFETEHIGEFDLYEPDIDDIVNKLADKENYPFIICKPIDGKSVVEIGWDTASVDGQIPETIMFGIEHKDRAYLGIVKKRALTSKLITDSLVKLSPLLEREGYRNFISIELRIKDKIPYPTDLTMRIPEPPSSLYMDGIVNLGDFINKGSQGIFVEPIYDFKYGAHLVMLNNGSEGVERRIRFPEEYKDNVKLKNLMIKDGIYTYVPLDRVHMKEIGSVVYRSKISMQDAIDNVKKIAETIKGNVKFDTDCLDKAMEEIKKCAKIGISF